MTPPLHELTAGALAARIRSGAVSPVDAVEACLGRIEHLDPRLRAWVFLDREGALKTAQALEDEARSGRIRGPLHGVPVALKDIFDVAGMATTSGAASFAHRQAAHDAPSVARLRQAGAVILGKTATTQFAFADPAETRNPWHLEYSPGGSSSGSAAAVASRMVPLALGSQTIGSTVRPAAYCGIVGFKPSYGAISTDGVTPLSWSLDHVGIFTRTVEDAALAFAVLSSPAGEPQVAGSLSPPHLGVPQAFVDAVSLREVKDHFAAAIEMLARAGARIDDLSLPASADRIDEVGRLVLRVEAAAYHRRWFPQHADEYRPKIRELVTDGLTVPGIDFVLAERARQRFRAEMAPVFMRYDALLLPAAPAAAPHLSLGSTGDPVLCAPWSFGGFPAIAVPSGLSAAGLPLAVQLTSGAGTDRTLLGVAGWCEAHLGFRAAPEL